MNNICVIFDLDGTLVDSEGLGNQAFLDLLPQLHDSLEALIERYRGQKLSSIMIDLENRLGLTLQDSFEQRYRQRVAERGRKTKFKSKNKKNHKKLNPVTTSHKK